VVVVVAGLPTLPLSWRASSLALPPSGGVVVVIAGLGTPPLGWHRRHQRSHPAVALVIVWLDMLAMGLTWQRWGRHVSGGFEMSAVGSKRRWVRNGGVGVETSTVRSNAGGGVEALAMGSLRLRVA